ncbi:DUF6090 family protein [[Muricauda] lutisoli]|uniref:Gliding motility-associated protein GldM N-terminal domain-containing protein n=1 Tax=[Muricauda] lutisoli TaxID=2816035 RepID=A0ABS3ETF1_9FLAO|nr:DUF6090 family protein [[Muricauda] lutisoli]MBO0329511.1 hypothetical protein [[Muricauda] lutisoli]
MLKFFRTIRQRLLSENKFNKYLLYAIGEIILVVIGILIALQINNWNEKRKDVVRASNYIDRISEDLERSVKTSENLVKLNKSILKSVTDTQKLLERGTELSAEEKETVDYAFLWFPRTTYQLPTMLTYEEMKASGDLYLIDDIEVRNKLAEYYNYLRQVESIYDKLSQDIESQFGVYNTKIRAHTNPETLDITFNYQFSDLCEDNVFINTFSRMTIHWRGFVYFMERVNRLSKELKLEIDNLN